MSCLGTGKYIIQVNLRKKESIYSLCLIQTFTDCHVMLIKRKCLNIPEFSTMEWKLGFSLSEANYISADPREA